MDFSPRGLQTPPEEGGEGFQVVTGAEYRGKGSNKRGKQAEEEQAKGARVNRVAGARPCGWLQKQMLPTELSQQRTAVPKGGQHTTTPPPTSVRSSHLVSREGANLKPPTQDRETGRDRTGTGDPGRGG